MTKPYWFILLLILSLLSVSACKKSAVEEPPTTFKLHPNPADSVLFIETQPANRVMQWQLYDIVGTQLMQGQVTGGKYRMQTDTLKSGIYLLRLNHQDTTVHKNRFVSRLVISH